MYLLPRSVWPDHEFEYIQLTPLIKADLLSWYIWWYLVLDACQINESTGYLDAFLRSSGSW